MRRPLLWIALAAVVAACASSAPAGTLAAPRFVDFADGFDQPVDVTSPIGEPGVLYVVEKGGLVRVFKDGQIRGQPFLDLSAEVATDGEEGLLSIAFDQHYATNRFVYVYYAALDRSIHIERFTTDGTAVLMGTRKLLLRIDHSVNTNHNGGLLLAPPDHRLYAGTGDGGGGNDTDNHSQDPTSRLGKLLALDLTHPSRGWRMVALGLRNPWRYSFDRATGDLYIGDVGQDHWEEVDVVHPSDSLLNMGWPRFEGKVLNRPDSTLATHTKLVAPVLVYSHQSGCAITGGFVYRGTAVPAAKGKYFYGDFCSGTVWTATVTNGKASAPVVFGKLPNPSSFGEDAAGELYATTFSGSVYRLQ